MPVTFESAALQHCEESLVTEADPTLLLSELLNPIFCFFSSWFPPRSSCVSLAQPLCNILVAVVTLHAHPHNSCRCARLSTSTLWVTALLSSLLFSFSSLFFSSLLFSSLLFSSLLFSLVLPSEWLPRSHVS